MDPRKAAILEHVITAYTEAATPIGSRFLVESGSFDVSPATMRNELMELEEEGYLAQPHTSAGRVPTEKAYRYYVEHCIADRPLPERMTETIARRVREADDERVAMKELAKAAADISHAAILVGFSPHDAYYTGLSYLFSQPEFSQSAEVTSLSSVLDHLDEVMEKLASERADDFLVAIGSENPFGQATSVILVRHEGEDGPQLFGILGPTRMNYATNIALAKFARTILEQYGR